MILGLGCDIVQVSRFAKKEDFLLKFIKKHFTSCEQKELEPKIKSGDVKVLTLAVATRFAAKEAVSKALGTGFQNGITLKDVEITHNTLGAPIVTLYNKALMRAFQASDNKEIKLHLTLSNEKEYVNAVAILESI